MQDQKHYDTIPGWNGARYEKKPVESGADILLDQRRVPTVWSRITAGKADDGKGNPIPPEVTVYFDQPKIGSSSNFGGKNGVDMGHAMLGIDYSRYSYETSRYERYAMNMIRKEAEALLGYPSDKKMYSAIMWKYANTLFDMVFKKDGRYITEQERASESLNNSRMANERKLYADMLKAYGFKIKYPAQDGAEPKPALNSIYKKLTA
jgi:hypothetical protein